MALAGIMTNAVVIVGAVLAFRMILTNPDAKETFSTQLESRYGINYNEFLQLMDNAYGTNLTETFGEGGSL